MARVVIEINPGIPGLGPMTRIEIRRKTTVAALGEAVAAALAASHLTFPALALAVRAALSASHALQAHDVAAPDGPGSYESAAAARRQSAGHAPVVTRDGDLGDGTSAWTVGPPESSIQRAAQAAVWRQADMSEPHRFPVVPEPPSSGEPEPGVEPGRPGAAEGSDGTP
jgi:hypothetical protein